MRDSGTADFDGRTGAAFIAGGTGGIGAEIVRTLAGRGSDVAFTYRGNETAAESITGEVKAYGRQVLALRLDLGDELATAGRWPRQPRRSEGCTRSCTRPVPTYRCGISAR